MESFLDELGDVARQVDRDCEDLLRGYSRAERIHTRPQEALLQSLSASGRSFGVNELDAAGIIQSKVNDLRQVLNNVEEAQTSARADVSVGELVEVITALRECNRQRKEALNGYGNASRPRARKSRRSVSSPRRRRKSRDSMGSQISDTTPKPSTKFERAKSRQADTSASRGQPTAAPRLHRDLPKPKFDELREMYVPCYPRFGEPLESPHGPSYPSPNARRVPTLDDCGLSNETLALLHLHTTMTDESFTK